MSETRPALTANAIGERLSMNRTSVYRLFTRKVHPLPHVKVGDTGAVFRRTRSRSGSARRSR